MKQFKQIILDNLNSIEWMYEKNAEGEYDPRAIYKGATKEIENVFHHAFADALIEWRDGHVSEWKGWPVVGTLATAPSPTPFTGTCSGSSVNCAGDFDLPYTMRNAFKLADPNMKFSHLKVFQAIYNWLNTSFYTIYVDGSMNLASNPLPTPIMATMLLSNATIMEGEILMQSQKEGFGMKDYWEIFGRYLDLSLTTSPQAPITINGMFNGLALTAVCTPLALT